MSRLLWHFTYLQTSTWLTPKSLAILTKTTCFVSSWTWVSEVRVSPMKRKSITSSLALSLTHLRTSWNLQQQSCRHLVLTTTSFQRLNLHLVSTQWLRLLIATSLYSLFHHCHQNQQLRLLQLRCRRSEWVDQKAH